MLGKTCFRRRSRIRERRAIRDHRPSFHPCRHIFETIVPRISLAFFYRPGFAIGLHHLELLSSKASFAEHSIARGVAAEESLRRRLAGVFGRWHDRRTDQLPWANKKLARNFSHFGDDL